MEGSQVNEIVNNLQRFTWVDYVVFVLMLAVSAVVGVYWGFMKKQSTQQDYLLGGRNMKVFPVAMSLVASFVSGITLLGSPTEMYLYGTQYAFIMGGIILMSLVMTQVYLPVFHDLKITSNYEVGWLPIVIYVPALAINQVTGIDMHVITPVVCLVCVFYTSGGGLQAVVWTDVIQISAMFGAMALVAIKGTINVGGFSEVWRLNLEGHRIETPNWDPSPLTRHTVWSLVIGGLVYWLQANAVNQTMVQRYLALPTLPKAKWAVIVFCIGISSLYCFCLYCGLLIYARFHDCDPLQTKLAKAKDQLLPLLVMDVLGDLPGLPGVFVAGIFSAALSSLSTSLNSMSAVVLEDFYKPFCKKELSERQTSWLMRSVVVIMGALCLTLVFVVEKLGTILQLTMTLEAITMGPQLGVFTMGILMPWVDSVAERLGLYYPYNGSVWVGAVSLRRASGLPELSFARAKTATSWSYPGALAGGVTGLAAMSWWCLSAQLALAHGLIQHSHKPLSVAGCTYNYTISDVTTPSPDINQAVNPLLRVSYMWYTLAGAAVAICVGAAVSGARRMRKGDAYVPPPPALLAPIASSLSRAPASRR
ncbi:Sodium-coupled monocarboxylate transporter 1 [Eumeta japonica]|uniref:Sodium-coupled monocarboxylate transporter 1 n=1 Tax=Eumeta variegata TaxID=151549 RepID=A0A4C1TIB7_EUMVA|nr:Sodium-coupled monocarboxylate transporter 1 [Eumeta japonica]